MHDEATDIAVTNRLAEEERSRVREARMVLRPLQRKKKQP
jgi:hypothetical protein